MRTRLWSKTFVKAFKQTLQRHPTLRPDLEATLRLLAEDPFAPSLATHKLKGKLSSFMPNNLILPNSRSPKRSFDIEAISTGKLQESKA